MKKLIIIIITFLISGCDLFNTRVPEPPDTSRSNYQLAFTPDDLIANLINSFKDKNVENYLSCLSDPANTSKIFSFSPSSEALAQFPALGDNWGVLNETEYLRNLIIKVPIDSTIKLTLSNSSSSSHGGDSITYVASYSLHAYFTDISIPIDYQGDLIFELIKDSRSVWSIYSWRDIKSSSLPSWSELKGRFY